MPHTYTCIPAHTYILALAHIHTHRHIWEQNIHMPALVLFIPLNAYKQTKKEASTQSFEVLETAVKSFLNLSVHSFENKRLHWAI